MVPLPRHALPQALPEGEGSRNDRAELQRRVAELAARLIARDGEEPEPAKRRAAALLAPPGGRSAASCLPSDEQLRAALRAYWHDWDDAEHRSWLQGQRRLALQWMQRLAGFHPYLVGAFLDGSAVPGEHLELDLFTDEAKEVEWALLELGIEYRAQAPPERAGREALQLRIGFVVASPGATASRRYAGPTPILLRVLDPLALRQGPGARRLPSEQWLHPVERMARADASMLSRLLDEPLQAPRD